MKIFISSYQLNILVLTTLFVSIFSSCKKQDNASPNSGIKYDSTLVNYLISKGYDKNSIQIKDSTFILDNDIVITFDEVLTRKKNESNNDIVHTEHWRHTYLVSSALKHNIVIFIDGGVPFDWQLAVHDAIDNWNSLGRTTMSLTLNPSAANIIVTMGYESANWVARANLPTSNGRPGANITINSYYNTIGYATKVFTTTHELGHTIGFQHTDQTTGIFITSPGPWGSDTPLIDPSSVMHSIVSPWVQFSAGDIQAIGILYPL
jgi:hypothetical protein